MKKFISARRAKKHVFNPSFLKIEEKKEGISTKIQNFIGSKPKYFHKIINKKKLKKPHTLKSRSMIII